jgi:hypothetical protein
MDDLGLRCESRDLARDPVVEPGAEGDQEVRLLHGRDRGVVAVHAGHAQAQLVAVGERSPGHEGGDHRYARHLGQGAKSLGRPRLQDAAPGVDDRSPALGDESRRLPDHARMAPGGGLVAGQVDPLRPVPVHGGVRDVLGHVDQDRPRTAGGGHVEGLTDDLGDVLGVGDEPVVLGDREGDPGGVALLEGIASDGAVGHLPGDDHNGGGVHVGVAQRGDDVGGGRSAGHHGHPRPAGGVGIPLGHVTGALLVAYENVADGGVDDWVVHRQDGSPGQAEHDLHPFHLEALYQGLGPGHLLHACS